MMDGQSGHERVFFFVFLLFSLSPVYFLFDFIFLLIFDFLTFLVCLYVMYVGEVASCS